MTAGTAGRLTDLYATCGCRLVIDPLYAHYTLATFHY